MKIISKFHDYYDSCLAYGQDDRVVYMRTMQEFKTGYERDMKDHPPIIKTLYKLFQELRKGGDPYQYTDETWYPRMMGGNTIVEGFTTKDHQYHFNTFSVLFCGKYYPGVRCQRYPRGAGMTPDKVDWFYDVSELLEFLKDHGQDLTKKAGRWDKKTAHEKIIGYFTTQQPDINWMIENKVTCVVYERYNNMIVVNPPLQAYGFYKVFDPYTAYQELDMWMAGTLAWPQNMMVEIEDKYRVMQHGFDMKYGFRKRPEGK